MKKVKPPKFVFKSRPDRDELPIEDLQRVWMMLGKKSSLEIVEELKRGRK